MHKERPLLRPFLGRVTNFAALRHKSDLPPLKDNPPPNPGKSRAKLSVGAVHPS